MKNKLLYANLLILLQNFENLWNMYSVSEGLLYREETKVSAKRFLELFKIIANENPDIRNSKKLQWDSTDSTERIDGINHCLDEWVGSDEKYPIASTEIGIGDNENSRYYLQSYFMCLSGYLSFKVLRLKYNPVICKSFGEASFHENNVKWNGRFPWQISDQVDNKFLALLGESETVVIIGDIRKSQDLITYAVNSDTYRRNMVSYIENVRKIILENMGIFDRFTGDGFICYFNAYLSGRFKRDLYKSVVDVCVKIQNESIPFFNQWPQGLQKLSQEPIGLSIGIDSGKNNFMDDRMMFAIGTPAVWATRMCAAGKASDIIFNNIPHSKICEMGNEHSFEEVYGSTKTGEQFKAFKLKYDRC